MSQAAQARERRSNRRWPPGAGESLGSGGSASGSVGRKEEPQMSQDLAHDAGLLQSALVDRVGVVASGPLC